MRAVQDAPDKLARESADTWLNELIWREFYQTILYHFPYVLKRNFQPAYDRIPWLNDSRDFQAWKMGQTGYPFVDAAMRQLAEEQWMHNRPRMIVASFLVKHLLVDWRWGETWFMQNLLDGDLAANNGGWQWTAGTGTDAAPYFRIFNPISQGKKFDPRGGYIRRYIPELESVPQQFIHTPWEMPNELQKKIGCVIGEDYPGPIVEHGIARERALEAYRVSREA
jgi:deoxyribodipyrimidine photo-lyase